MLFRLLAVPCFRRFDVGLSPRRLGFDPRSDHERFMLDKVALRLVSQYFGWPVPPVLDTLLHPHVARTYQKDKLSKPGNLPKYQCSFGNQDHWIEKYFLLVFLSSLHAGAHFEAFHLPFAGYQYFFRKVVRPAVLTQVFPVSLCLQARCKIEVPTPSFPCNHHDLNSPKVIPLFQTQPDYFSELFALALTRNQNYKPLTSGHCCRYYNVFIFAFILILFLSEGRAVEFGAIV